MPSAPAVEDPAPAPPTSKDEDGDGEETTGGAGGTDPEPSPSATIEGKDDLRRCGGAGDFLLLTWRPSSAASSLSLRRFSMACCRLNLRLSTRRCLAPGLKLEPIRSLGPRPRRLVALAEATSFVGPSWLNACGYSPKESI